MEPYFTAEQVRLVRLATIRAMFEAGVSSQEDRLQLTDTILAAFSEGMHAPSDLARFAAKRFLGVRSGAVIDLVSRKKQTQAATHRA